MAAFGNQLKQVLRRLRSAPLFTAITLITLAAGVGAKRFHDVTKIDATGTDANLDLVRSRRRPLGLAQRKIRQDTGLLRLQAVRRHRTVAADGVRQPPRQLLRTHET